MVTPAATSLQAQSVIAASRARNAPECLSSDRGAANEPGRPAGARFLEPCRELSGNMDDAGLQRIQVHAANDAACQNPTLVVK